MAHLIAVSLLWAFSFGLIKVGLTDLDSTAVTVARLAFALVVFLPLWRPRALPRPAVLRLAAIGAVQFGLMYVCYVAAFRHLQAFEVAMFTLFTPIYVVLFDGALAGRLDRRALLAAGLALVGAAILKWRSGFTPDGVTGLLLVQASNLCFAAGQVHYRRFRLAYPKTNDAAVFAWLLLGAVAAALAVSLTLTDWRAFAPSPSQWAALAYLGVLASGLGFFGWNVGATRVNAGTLAVFNNLKVPLAVAVALIFFGETADPLRLGASLTLMAGALWLTERRTAV